MAGVDIQRKAIDAMTVMNVAVKNIRLYPPTSAIIRNTVERAHLILREIFRVENSVIFSESGKNFVICGQVFTEIQQKQHPQALAFFEMMVMLGLKGVSFEKHLGVSELRSFLQIVGKPLKELEDMGGIQAVAEKERLPNVLMDHKMYVVMDKDQRIVTGLAMKDQELLDRIVDRHGFSEQDASHFRAMAGDPAWLEKVFETGVSHLMGLRGSRPDRDLSENLNTLTGRVGKAAADTPHRDRVFDFMGQSLASIDDALLGLTLALSSPNDLPSQTYASLLASLDPERLTRLREQVARLAPGGSFPLPDFSGEGYGACLLRDTGKCGPDAMHGLSREEQNARLKKGLTSLLSKDRDYLSDPVFLRLLPEYLAHLTQSGKSANVSSLLGRMTEGLTIAETRPRHASARLLLETFDVLDGIDAPERDSLLAGMAVPLMEWIGRETDPPPFYERSALRVSELTARLIRENRAAECPPILERFAAMRRDGHRVNGMCAGVSDTALRKLCTGDLLEQLMESHQRGDDALKAAIVSLLGYLGNPAMEWLLEILQKSRDMSERVRVLRIISEIDNPGTELLTGKIREGGPWFYLRNMILALGRIGSPADLPVLEPLLAHEDFRVQRETLNSIYTIGGDRRGPILVAALEKADERLRLSIIDMLGALRHEPAVPVLLEMLTSKSLFSSKFSEKIQEKVCHALGRIGSPQAIPGLRSIAEQKKLLGIAAHSDHLKQSARGAIHAIEAALRAPEPIRPDAPAPENPPPPGSTAPVVPELRLRPAPSPPTPAAPSPRALLEEIRRLAEEREFDQAEALRQRLVDMNEVALAEVVEAEDILERERRAVAASDTVEEDHLGIWPELYDSLTPEEANTLYYAMEEATHGADETIFRQGDQSNRLYFIQKGQLKMVFHQGGREILIKTLGHGDIVGEETFFAVSVCTTSMITLSYVELSYLDKSVLDDWKTEFPALESKLHDYCLGLERIHDVLRGKGIDRRQQARHDIKGVVSLQLLRPTGGGTGKFFKGALEDISAGGLSFLITFPNPRNSSLLLGRHLEIDLDLPMITGRKMMPWTAIPSSIQNLRLKQTGTVIGVTHRGGAEYMVHVKFDYSLVQMMPEGAYGENPGGNP